MSTPAPPPHDSGLSPTGGTKEIRIYSHSGLYYWWPVWLFGFIFALWTLLDNDRLAIVPSNAVLVKEKVVADGGKESTKIRIVATDYQHEMDKIGRPASEEEKKAFAEKNEVGVNAELLKIQPRISSRTWMGPLYVVILSLVIIITNVPLRGLWSLVATITLITGSLFISVFHWWDNIFDALYGLHVFINMAGYLFLATVVFAGWAMAVFVFDKRSYIIFSPGQIKVCEQIGGREKVYDTTGMTIDKLRDDWFRHIFLGFGSGDLSVRTAGADRHEIVMPNVSFIGFKIGPIEQLLRERQTTKVPS